MDSSTKMWIVLATIPLIPIIFFAMYFLHRFLWLRKQIKDQGGDEMRDDDDD